MSLPLITLDVRLEPDILLARQRARQIAGLLKFVPLDQTRIATAVSEIVRNTLQFAGGGKVEFHLDLGPPPGFVINVQERGAVVKDLQAILDGQSDPTSAAGTGIMGAKRLMDEFTVAPSPKGVTIRMLKKLPKGSGSWTAQDLARLSGTLAVQKPQGLLAELQVQNQELLRTLQELRDRQAEIADLHTRELEETNRGVVALYSELDESAKELRRISELKSRFLSNMSHEFRSPLNTILSMSGFLLSGSSGQLSAEQQKEIHFIRKAAEGLTALVNDLLDLAKVEAGKAEIRIEAFEIAELFENLLGTTKPLLTGNSVALVVEPPAGMSALQTDEGKITQILRNFLSNAVKFTQRGEIRLAARPGPGDTVMFTVSDTGIGIALKDQKRVFEEFNQVEGPVQNKIKGTGLGLPLSRKLAELLGGQITVRSELGAGSTFVALIPRVFQPDTVATSTDELGQVNRELAPVLIIDDDPLDLMLYEKYLQVARFPVLAARNHAEARRLLRQHRPAAIVLNIIQDAELNWSLLSEVKGQASTRDIPVFAVGIMECKEQALAQGATDFCLKPIDSDWLLTRLAALAPAARRCRILIIDDSDADRYVLMGRLAKLGHFAILEASGGEEGVRQARAERPDLIFLDLIMPDRNGFEVLEDLKSDEVTKKIPVVLNTSAILSAEERHKLTARTAAIVSKSASLTNQAFATIREALMHAGLNMTLVGTER